MAIEKDVRSLLACPKCKGPLEETPNTLVCASCNLSYEIKDNIPVLLIDKAIPITELRKDTGSIR